jgi:hypothetical protein
MAEGPYPIAKTWQDVGLGHLLPLKITGDDWPVHNAPDCIIIGREQHGPEKWHTVSDQLDVGFYGDPLPSHFERQTIIPGAKITDATNREWIIPNANPQSITCSIPNELEWGTNGPQLVPDEKYRAAMDYAVQLFQEVIDRETLDHVWTAEQALRILQINYRIGNPELAAFGSRGTRIITKDFAAQVVLWFIDYTLIRETLKKN